MNAFDDWREREWSNLSVAVAMAWLAFYVLFLLHAASNQTGFLFVDNANLVVHEAGHLLFGWFGETLGLLGGTLFQLIVPLALAVSFAYRKQTTGLVFCAFFFFENFLYIATYMADARSQELPLVSVGGGDAVDHDWYRIFSGLGVLQHDTYIAAVVRVLGWIGMLATVGWLVWQARIHARSQPARAASI